MRTLQRLALAAALVLCSACVRWTIVGALPRSGELPRDLRITKWDSSVVRLSRARIDADTIRGFREGSREQLTVALAAVDLIERRELQWKQTGIAAVSTLAGFYLLLRLLESTQLEGRPPSPPTGFVRP